MNDPANSHDVILDKQPQQEKLNFITKLAFGAGDMGAAITANVLVFFLLPFFTNVAGLPAGLAGSILTIGKISDAINDPIIGVMSDRTRSRWGRRLPWMLFGAIPFGILFFLQWVVPRFSNNDAVNDWWLFGYYILIAVLFNLAYTAVNLPYTALTPELTQDYNERTSLNSFRFAFSIGASILSLVLAGLIFAAFPNDGKQQYLVLALITSILAVIPIFWCVSILQERGAKAILNQQQKKILGFVLLAIAACADLYGITSVITAEVALNGIVAILLGLLTGVFGLTLLFYRPEAYLRDDTSLTERTEPTESLSFQEQLRIVFSNKAFLCVIGIYLSSWLAVQLTASILIYFVVIWMGLSEAQSTIVALAVQGTALVMLFVWKQVSEKVGKKAVYFLGTGLWIIAQAGLFLLQPGQTGLMYFLAIVAGFGVSVAYLIPWSMVPDVIELDELRTGQRREGIFYGFMVLLQKLGLAIALFVVGVALEWAGFVESVSGQPLPTQPESALLAIRLAIGPLPTLALIAGLVFTYLYPITREFHTQIRLQLQQRSAQRPH
ncbi:MAG: MFS transporter [Oscillatoria sp. PMC 1051.18]|nr:MFS transporter [Oscillatoria sp. PMC 1050.18]MEC5031344.1 MFS transporter [Oscillatoria sp. PMC 1051.18]